MRYRLVRPTDWVRFPALLQPAFQCSDAIRGQLPDLWKALFAEGAISSGLVEDLSLPESDQLQAFGISGFLTDAFVADALQYPTPGLAARVYELALTGRSPLLRGEALRAANRAGTLNLAILQFTLGGRPLFASETAPLLRAVFEVFGLQHGGYQLQKVLQEVYGPEEQQYMLSGGFELVSDFPAAVSSPSAQRPSLYCADRERLKMGTAISFLFNFAAPKFGFSPAQQALLRYAVFDESDEQVAERLSVSPDTIRKQWQRIYARVAAVDPALVPPRADLGEGRGVEKRRRVLSYLRAHAEELRPFSRQS